MARNIRIALVGDRSDSVRAHEAIPIALRRAADTLGCVVEATWLGTDALARSPQSSLAEHAAFWCVPGSPYADLDGALRAIRFAREARRPFLGTCGGFQHALIEYARNVRGMGDADHAESNPGGSLLLIAPLACPLVDVSDPVRLVPGSRLARIYGTTEAVEEYHCRFSLHPDREADVVDGVLSVAARDARGEVRAVELSGEGFFVATQFQPELAALRGVAHPLVAAFVRAAAEGTPAGS